MDPRLLRYYNDELKFMREMGGEFARRYPKIAARLGLDAFECADPYVERLLEGFAFLAARIQLKLDAEFPEFTQHLLELVYPDYLAPTPSMAIVQFQPELTEAGLAEGFTLPRDTVLRSLLGKGDRTPCEFRTATDLTLWPIELDEVEYVTNTSVLPDPNLPRTPSPRAGLRFRLRATAGLSFDQILLEDLPLYLRGSDELPMRIYEQLLGNTLAVMVRPLGGEKCAEQMLPASAIGRAGFDSRDALLPEAPQSFSAYRLLHEYFSFSNRFMFVELRGLGQALRRCTGSEVEILVLLKRSELALERKIGPEQFALFCTPAINLFPKRSDRIHVNLRDNEYHVVPDRTRPMDFEVYGVAEVKGYGSGDTDEQVFRPLYGSSDLRLHGDSQAFYTIRRERRVLSERQRQQGPRSSYVGSEVFLSLADAAQAPFRQDLRQVGVETWCTNRDLPMQMPVGVGKTDFTMESGAPVNAVRVIAGPSRPRPSLAEGDTAWRIVSHLSLNYLSLVEADAEQGAAALRELLSLYGDLGDANVRQQIEGVRSVSTRPVIRRISSQGPAAFGRGLEVTVTIDETAFEGTGCFLLGAILAELFARYVSINSFAETVVRTVDRGEIMRWPARTGQRHIL